MSVVGTLIVDFGESVQSESGNIRAEWDDSLNQDDEGKAKSSFLPGEEAFLLVHHDQDVRILAVKATDGTINEQGEVVLPRDQQLGFGDVDDVQSLNYLPASVVSMSWFGREGIGKVVSSKEISMQGGFPCLGLAGFSVLFKRYRLQTPTMDLAEGETWPIRVYIYYEVSS